ncbi:hypothetical protein ABER99_21875 [Paenibacillus glucanolyticus]|jgi:hypothetical protein|uniref:Uncharacterized protein n=1 Tax=Paenibacillus glucanolyticus TaxID=59843 RepID=A0A163GP88_9BACL|nr:hypothetical protein [Paenibacillus glucanolyticus]KZS45073.1 hypothetical protein AWU65_03580 [Paenibacillus glucanolyticus]
MNQSFNEKPDIKDLNQLDAGVLIHKYICILAMMNFGTAEEKRLAMKKLPELERMLAGHINEAAFKNAIEKLDWNQEEVNLLNAV